MGRRRHRVSIQDDASWVFNEMAEFYDARPTYPGALIDAVVEVAAPLGSRVLELGAGTGHFALPLAERGLDVVAVEPARAMLERLHRAASGRGVTLRAVHAAAEALPFTQPVFDVALIADAVHFCDPELVAAELLRVLVPGGALVVVTAGLAETPFMNGVRALLRATSERRPRETRQAIRQLATLADVRLTIERCFHDETHVAPATLARILRSLSFVGPDLAPERLATFCEELCAQSEAPSWARSFRLHAGYRRRRSVPWQPRPRSRGGPLRRAPPF